MKKLEIVRPPRRPSIHPLRTAGLAALGLLGVPTSACFDPDLVEPGATAAEGDSSDGSSGDALGGTSSGSESDSSGALPAICGDGIVEGDEICDDGVNNGSYGGCASGCDALGPHCGDGLVNGGEACDDGDELDGNGCNVDCVISGTELWTVIYDGPAHGVDSGKGAAVDGDGNVIVSADAYDEVRQGLIRKYSPEGHVLWSEWIPGPTGQASNGDIIALPSNDIVVAGSFDTTDGSTDSWLRSFNSTGIPIWTEIHASVHGGRDRITEVVQDRDGFIYALIEEGDADTETTYQTMVRKYSPDGSEVWTRMHPGDLRGRHLAIDGQDDLLIAGTTAIAPESTWIQKTSSDGAEIWIQSLGEGNRLSNFIAASRAGQVAVALWPTNADERVMRLDPSGAQIDVIFPSFSEGDDQILAGHYDTTGNLILGGSVIAANAEIEGWTSKHDPAGTEVWTNMFDGQLDSIYNWDRTAAITTDSYGNTVITGTIMDSPTGDIIVAKYAP